MAHELRAMPLDYVQRTKIVKGSKGVLEAQSRVILPEPQDLVVVARKRAKNGAMDSWRPSAVEAHPVDSCKVFC